MSGFPSLSILISTLGNVMMDWMLYLSTVWMWKSTLPCPCLEVLPLGTEKGGALTNRVVFSQEEGRWLVHSCAQKQNSKCQHSVTLQRALARIQLCLPWSDLELAASKMWNQLTWFKSCPVHWVVLQLPQRPPFTPVSPLPSLAVHLWLPHFSYYKQWNCADGCSHLFMTLLFRFFWG